MKIVVDGMAGAPGSSGYVILEQMLAGWAELGIDELHVLLHPESTMVLHPSIHVEPVPFGRNVALSRVRAQTLQIPRLCRRIGADALLGFTPSTSVAPLPCPRVIIAYDMRHDLLPHQFPFRTRYYKKFSYSIGWHQADAIACITERTRNDLVGPRPWLRDRLVGIAPLGSDHVASWSVAPSAEPYAVAFGQYGNKNVDMVIDAWGLLRDRGHVMPLKLIGMPDSARATAEAHIARLGLGHLVTPVGWLFGDDLRQCFGGAGLFVFPSEFEGFGIPAVEAMRLRIPLVISPEAALREVTGGHATVMSDFGAAPLADAVQQALTMTAEQLDAARDRAMEFTWKRMASSLHDLIVAAHERRRAHPPDLAIREAG
ncbi:MAG TPA: glycosyltransferase family 1 protein [Acidimicrobiales bacterium]|jgi:glycosyltransferase involved in cell wall biosynthesis